MQHHVRLAGFFAANFHVLPAQFRADAGAERLGDRFLGRKPRRQKRPRPFVGKTIGCFAGSEDALEKAVAKFLVSRFDALDLDDIHACAKYVQSFKKRSLAHQQQHFLHGGGQPDDDGPADDAVADVQFHEVRHLAQNVEILIIQSVSGIDLQA